MAEHEEKGRPRKASPMRWLSRELSRIRLTVWLLIVMTVTMIVGSIFPQGYGADTYIESWGEARYAVLAKCGLLNLFHTKYFLILGAILLLNLVFCSLLRWFGRTGAGLALVAPPPHAKAIEMGGTADKAVARAKDVLTSRGYKILSASGNVITARRGLWPEGVSLLYHIAMGVAIIGFIISALTSFEGDVTLYPGEPVSVATVSTETGAFGLRNGLADWSVGGWHPFAGVRPDTTAREGYAVTLTLNEFITEWELHNEKYYPKDWVSDIAVDLEAGATDMTWDSRLVEVNRPLRVGGLTFYQMAYEQQFDVVVTKDGEEIERVSAEAYVPFTLESVGGMFFPGTLRVGTLFQKYHDSRPVVPHTPLKWQPPEEPVPEEAEAAEEPVAGTDSEELAQVGEAGREPDEAGEEAEPAEEETPAPAPPERIELGDLSAGEPLEVEGVTLTLESPYEGSVLSYRHDPAVPLLYIAIIAFMAGLAIRTYWPSYRVNLWIEESAGRATARLAFRATGMLGEPEDIEDALIEELGD